MSKFNHKAGVLCASLITLGATTTQAATLQVVLGGQAVYDPDTSLTWLKDANAGAGTPQDDGASSSDGKMTWVNANAWAATVAVGGYNWRLPTTPVDDGGCSVQNPNGDNGTGCSASEMGHMYYTEGITAATPGDFLNMQSAVYWSSTEYAANTAFAWDFNLGTGVQDALGKGNEFYAWAVTDEFAIPVPAAVWLFGSGLLGLIGVARRKRQA